jgi:hypothetical protein
VSAIDSSIQSQLIMQGMFYGLLGEMDVHMCGRERVSFSHLG